MPAPNANTALPSPTEAYKKLLKEKFPPKTDDEKVFHSIVISVSERADRLEAQNVEIIKACGVLAFRVAQIEAALKGAAEGEAPAASAAGDAVAVGAGEEQQEEEGGIPKPDVVASKPMNASPIPVQAPPPPPAPPVTAPPSPNGAKGGTA
jgi:hypothetical protein